MKIIGFACLAAVLAVPASAQSVTDDSARRIDPETLKTAMKAVSDEMRDPGSTLFRNLFSVRKGEIICGEVNSKNGFGAYVGYMAFSYDKVFKFQTILNPNDEFLYEMKATVLKLGGCLSEKNAKLLIPND